MVAMNADWQVVLLGPDASRGRGPSGTESTAPAHAVFRRLPCCAVKTARLRAVRAPYPVDRANHWGVRQWAIVHRRRGYPAHTSIFAAARHVPPTTEADVAAPNVTVRMTRSCAPVADPVATRPIGPWVRWFRTIH
jgi:hypothetical protein